MRKSILLGALTAAALSWGSTAQASPDYYTAMNAGTETPFLGNPLNITIRHTWGDSWSYDELNAAPHQTDTMESWMSGTGRCTSTTSARGCSWAYRPTAYNYVTYGGSFSLWWSYNIGYWYDQYIPGTYLVAGVCHQATNRSNRHLFQNSVAGYGVLGSSASQSVFGTCGKYGPYGPGMSCP
jgi:hypothetical protein